MAKIYDNQDTSETLITSRNAEDAEPAADAESFAQYDIRREIGRGALSVVYEAWDTKTARSVALKLLKLPTSLPAAEAEDITARFERQARAVARLSHPNVVRVYEAGVQQNQHFVSMEYLRGQTLRDRMKHGVFLLSEAYPILVQAAQGLDAFHKAGLVHRAIKPTNIMLLPGGAVKLLDFGIASPKEPAAASAGVVLGSPSYMAPEQVKGEAETAASDIWALGVLTCEMLAGCLPFAGKTAGSVLYQVVHQPPASVSGLPLNVQRVLHRALDKRPSQRYPSASDLVQALQPAAEPPAVSAAAAFVPTPAPSTPAAPIVFMPEVTTQRPASTSRLLPAAGMLALFLLGLGGTVLVRHSNVNVGRKETVSQSVRPVTAPIAQAAVPEAAPVLHSVPVTTQQTTVAARRNLILPQIQKEAAAQAAPAPVPPLIPQSVPALPAQPHRPVAVKHIAVPQIAARTLVPAAARRVPMPAVQPAVQVAAQHVPVQRIDSYQSEVQRIPASAASEPRPAQSAAQSFTLPPSDDNAADPEAEARLRKSAWSQSGNVGSP